MSIDLDFWRVREGVSLDHAAVYRRACCDGEAVEGLEDLPVEEILRAVASAFPEWEASGALDYQREGRGSFQVSAAPRMVRFDCYGMEREDMRRFSALMAKFGCPLYDPQLEVRFDSIGVFLVDEAGAYREQAEGALARLLPGLALRTFVTDWEEYQRRSRELGGIQYNAVIHRGKAQTKVTSFMQFGRGWASRPCQCKTAQLEDPEAARRLLGELLEKSLERAVSDFLDRTYWG